MTGLVSGVQISVVMPERAAASASLAVSPEEQGAAAGLVSSCPALGFVAGPICAGALYQIHGTLAPLFSAAVFLSVLGALAARERRARVCN